MPTWVRDFLILPLIVGIIVAAFTVGLPKVTEEERELSYNIEGPIRYLDDSSIGEVDVVVNGVKITSLNAYKAKFWNSGDKPLKKIPIRFVFDTKDSNFKIFRATHKTTPRYEFGKITEEGSNAFSKRFIYDLLNPNDSDIVTFLTNSDPRLELYAKLEDLQIKRVDEGEPLSFTDYLRKSAILLAVIAVIGALLFQILKFFQDILSEFKKWLTRRRQKEDE